MAQLLPLRARRFTANKGVRGSKRRRFLQHGIIGSARPAFSVTGVNTQAGLILQAPVTTTVRRRYLRGPDSERGIERITFFQPDGGILARHHARITTLPQSRSTINSRRIAVISDALSVALNAILLLCLFIPFGEEIIPSLTALYPSAIACWEPPNSKVIRCLFVFGRVASFYHASYHHIGFVVGTKKIMQKLRQPRRTAM